MIDKLKQLVLVGFLVMAEQGSLLQITMGMLVSLAFTFAQMQAQPFVLLIDDFLALVANYGLTLIFFGSLVFQVGGLTSNELVASRMTAQMKKICACTGI